LIYSSKSNFKISDTLIRNYFEIQNLIYLALHFIIHDFFLFFLRFVIFTASFSDYKKLQQKIKLQEFDAKNS
jgi:hypothetical protein